MSLKDKLSLENGEFVMKDEKGFKPQEDVDVFMSVAGQPLRYEVLKMQTLCLMKIKQNSTWTW